jgi:hypothetical protein
MAGYDDFFDPATATLHVRTKGGKFSLAVIGARRDTGRRLWIWAGADARGRKAPVPFLPQQRPYASADAARKDASRIFPTREDFERFLQFGFNGERLDDDFEPAFIPDTWVSSDDSSQAARSNDLPDDDYNDDVDQQARSVPERMMRIVEVIKRDRARAAAVKAAANYTCEICRVRAAWCTKSGLPYCETHHLIPLGLSGSDVEENLIVLCADCHRRLHYGDGGLEESYRIFGSRTGSAAPAISTSLLDS